jgi:hypothetical protein
VNVTIVRVSVRDRAFARTRIPDSDATLTTQLWFPRSSPTARHGIGRAMAGRSLERSKSWVFEPALEKWPFKKTGNGRR